MQLAAHQQEQEDEPADGEGHEQGVEHVPEVEARQVEAAAPGVREGDRTLGWRDPEAGRQLEDSDSVTPPARSRRALPKPVCCARRRREVNKTSGEKRFMKNIWLEWNVPEGVQDRG